MNSFFKREIFNASLLNIVLTVCFGAVIYTYYPFIQNYSTTPKWIVLSFFGIIFSVIKIKTPIRLSWGVIIWSLFVIQYILQCFRAYNFWDSLLHSMPLIIAPLIGLVITKYIHDLNHFYRKMSVIIAVLILPILGYILYEMGSLYTLNEYNHGTSYGFRFTFGHRNQLAQFLALLVPLIFMGIIHGTKNGRKYILGAFIAIIYLICSLLMCRSVLIVLYGLYPLAVALYFLSSLKKKWRTIFMLIAIVFAIIFGTLALKKPEIIPGLKYFTETNFGSGNERVRIWKNSLDLWKEKPIIGHGSNDWKIEILRTPLRFTQAEESMVYYQRAHNDFIQIATENGLIGWFILALSFIMLGIGIFKSELNKLSKIALITGVFGFVIIANFSFPLEKVELLILLFIFAIPGYFNPKHKDDKLKYPFKPVHKVLPVLGTMVLVLSLVWIKTEQKYAGFKSNNQLKDLKEINLNFYTIDPMSTPLYWHLANNYYYKNDFQSAIGNYEKALKYNPNHIHIINNLGSSYFSIGNMDAARQHYDKALAINPIFTETLMNYAALEFNNGNIDGALGHALSVLVATEPINYKMYISAIGRAKFEWLIDLYDEPEFEQFLISNLENNDLYYNISVRSRTTGARL